MQSNWINEAAQLPLAFAQVREDALLDLAVVNDWAVPVRVLMVGSGGCTAATLAASGKVAYLHLVDFNPAQLALCRVKLHLLMHAAPRERMEILGHASLPHEERGRRLRTLLAELAIPSELLGPEKILVERGLDHAGRYEAVFAQLRQRLGDVADDLAELLAMRNPGEQAQCTAHGTALGSALDDALSDAMSLPNLVALFGDDATANPVKPFARHFGDRIRQTLATFPAADNPYLAQMLLGRFPNGVAYPWLHAEAPAKLPETVMSCGRMNDVLRAAGPESYEIVHLSNILDWLSPDAAGESLALAARALVPGGVVVIRQLNSSLNIPARGCGFDWQSDRAATLHAADRSFFYRGFHFGRKNGGSR